MTPTKQLASLAHKQLFQSFCEDYTRHMSSQIVVKIKNFWRTKISQATREQLEQNGIKIGANGTVSHLDKSSKIDLDEIDLFEDSEDDIHQQMDALSDDAKSDLLKEISPIDEIWPSLDFSKLAEIAVIFEVDYKRSTGYAHNLLINTSDLSTSPVKTHQVSRYFPDEQNKTVCVSRVPSTITKTIVNGDKAKASLHEFMVAVMSSQDEKLLSSLGIVGKPIGVVIVTATKLPTRVNIDESNPNVLRFAKKGSDGHYYTMTAGVVSRMFDGENVSTHRGHLIVGEKPGTNRMFCAMQNYFDDTNYIDHGLKSILSSYSIQAHAEKDLPDSFGPTHSIKLAGNYTWATPNINPSTLTDFLGSSAPAEIYIPQNKTLH